MAKNRKYAMVFNQWSRETSRVPLPAIAGSDPACDIIINADAVAGQAYALKADDKAVGVIHLKTGQALSTKALERYGIQISKPLMGDLAGAKPNWREWAAREELWFARFPKWLGLGLGGSLPQRYRGGLWAVVAFLAVVFTVMPAEKVELDYSNQPIAMTMDQVNSTVIGVTIQRRGYEKGALLTVNATAKEARQALLLSFRAAKLDLGGELVVVTSKGVAYKSRAMPNCMKQFCDIKVRIPAGALKEGHNEIRLIHDPKGGFYILGDLLIRSLPKIKDEEIRRVERWEQIANRAYNERDIVPENLVRVRKELDNALDFLNTREGADSLRARIEAFRAEAEDAFDKEVKDRWARVDINQKLKKYDSATFHLERLRGLYPDTSSKQHQAVQARLRKIKELQR